MRNYDRDTGLLNEKETIKYAKKLFSENFQRIETIFENFRNRNCFTTLNPDKKMAFTNEEAPLIMETSVPAEDEKFFEAGEDWWHRKYQIGEIVVMDHPRGSISDEWHPFAFIIREMDNPEGCFHWEENSMKGYIGCGCIRKATESEKNDYITNGAILNIDYRTHND